MEQIMIYLDDVYRKRAILRAGRTVEIVEEVLEDNGKWEDISCKFIDKREAEAVVKLLN